MTEQGDRLQALAKARSETLGTVTKSERERDSILQRRLPQETRVGLKTRVAALTESRRTLDELKELASSGSSILRRDVQAEGVWRSCEKAINELPRSEFRLDDCARP